MTTAMLMERTGLDDYIHLSEASADALIKAGKEAWVRKREKKLTTESKGEIQTYWLNYKSLDGDQGAARIGNEDRKLLEFASTQNSKERWIQWNVETFKGVSSFCIYFGWLPENENRCASHRLTRSPQLIKDIVARREKAFWNNEQSGSLHCTIEADMPAEEVVEIVELPRFDRKSAKRQLENKDEVILSPLVDEQLTEYITEVANMYNDNPFHNFAHASYGTPLLSSTGFRISL